MHYSGDAVLFQQCMDGKLRKLCKFARASIPNIGTRYGARYVKYRWLCGWVQVSE